MFTYIIRRTAYAIPILLGVNFLLFIIFFYLHSPDDMAETFLGDKYTTTEMKETWKREHGYHLPRFINTSESFPGTVTQTIFWTKSMRLFVFDFGKADMDGSDIGTQLTTRIPYSLMLTIPIFIFSFFIYLFVAMIVAFYRATYIDTWALVICVALMSVPILIYILVGQLLATRLSLAPVSGFDRNLVHAIKFLVLPVFLGIISSIGGNVRYYRTIFLEEINKDYIRTARSKGLSEKSVLFKHALKNALFPILTNVIVSIPMLITGMLLLENFFGIPGLGSYLIDAIHRQDFAIVKAMVFLSAVLYVLSLICVEISYSIVDPRVRLGNR